MTYSDDSLPVDGEPMEPRQLDSCIRVEHYASAELEPLEDPAPIQLGRHRALLLPEPRMGTAAGAAPITRALDLEEAGERWTVGLLRWTSIER